MDEVHGLEARRKGVLKQDKQAVCDNTPEHTSEGARSKSHLEHVNHLLQLGGFDARCLLHCETFEVLDDAEAVDLGLLVLQQLLQDDAVRPQNLTPQKTHTQT